MLLLASCHARAHHGEKKEGHAETEEEEEAEENAFGVPIAACACSTGNGVITLHAPRTGNILWWFGVARGASKDLEELSIYDDTPVIPPRRDAHMLMACDGDLSPRAIVALVRENNAVGWDVTNPAKRATVRWKVTLPKPLDASTIDAPPVKHSASRVGCMSLTGTHGAFDVRLQDGVRGTLAITDGKWTPSPGDSTSP